VTSDVQYSISNIEYDVRIDVRIHVRDDATTHARTQLFALVMRAAVKAEKQNVPLPYGRYDEHRSLRFCRKIYETVTVPEEEERDADRSTETRDAFTETALFSSLFVIATFASTYALQLAPKSSTPIHFLPIYAGIYILTVHSLGYSHRFVQRWT